jgi:hypothetical protein
MSINITQILSLAACWAGAAAVAFFIKEPIVAIIALACAYYLSKAIVTGSTDS